MHIFLTLAQSPGRISKFGGGGDAGTSEHQFGLTGAAGVACRVAAGASCASAFATINAVPIVTKIAMAVALTKFMFPRPHRLAFQFESVR
jgi:hypothetical protein